uniref:Uncharacterized protein n=1 Tax=Arion vulgaris TaxID=1028688 RepID=A0A0B6ZKS2_9EUPU
MVWPLSAEMAPPGESIAQITNSSKKAVQNIVQCRDMIRWRKHQFLYCPTWKAQKIEDREQDAEIKTRKQIS